MDVYRPGDANALVVLTSSDEQQITFQRKQILFGGATGAVVAATDGSRWAAETHGVLYGLHVGRFADPFVRLLYVLSSIAGTAMIATGLVLWTAKRRPVRQTRDRPSAGWRLVDALNVGTIVGLPIAMAAFFWANRLLPVELGGRANLEAGCFFLAWLLAIGHAALRPSARAWTEQLATAALLYAALPVVNAATTGSHLGATVPRGDWVLAGFDLTMLASGLLLAWTARHVARNATKSADRKATMPARPRTERGE